MTLNKKAPADAKQRAEALDITQSFIVQAPAGSGKTELLTQRYLKLLGAVDEPEEALAITFTKKAAGEMRERVLSALRNAKATSGMLLLGAGDHELATLKLADEVLRHDEEQGWQILDMPSRLRIQTIDSFCFSLVQQMPMQARFGVAGKIAEADADRRKIFEEAAYNTIRHLGSEHDPTDSLARILRHRDNNVKQVAGLLCNMLQRRDQWERHIAGRHDTAALRREIEGVLESIICKALERVRDRIPLSLRAELVQSLRYAAANLNGGGKPNPYAACLDVTKLPGCTVGDVEKWRVCRALLVKSDGQWRQRVNVRNGFPPGLEKKRFEEFLGLISVSGEELLQSLGALDTLPTAKFDNGQWDVLEALLTVLPLAIRELRASFQRHGAVDFIEVSQGALRALEQGGGTTGRLQHLLVDEFQDTSESQWRLLQWLTKEWRNGDGRTLFLVGDPMQSIYRFRQAEVGLFLRAKERGIGQLKLRSLALNVNFRSDEALVGWFNQQFRPIFGERDDATAGVVSFNRANAAPDAAPGTRPMMHAAEDYEDEAAQVADRAAEALEGEGDVAILVRARTHLAQIIPALKERGLHFQAVEIDRLGERQPVLDALMLTRALLRPSDRLAWIATLRAPWCGLKLADMDALCQGDTRSAMCDLMTRHVEALSQDGRERIERLRKIIAPAMENRRRVSVRQWVESTWIALGGPACLESQSDLDDVATFFDLLGGVEKAGEVDTSDLAERVSALFASAEADANERLKILTIHKAKGLQFGTVILAGAGRRPQKDDPPLLLWEERLGASGPELLLAPIYEKGVPDNERDAIYRYLQRAEAARKREEDKRLLYVAATRAKHRLHVVAVPSVTQDGQIHRDGSLLQHLWAGVCDEFQQGGAVAAIAAAEKKNEQIPPPRVPIQLRRLPGDWTLPVGPVPVKWKSAEAVIEPHGELTYDWVSEKRRRIGTVAHAVLQRIARDGFAKWSDEKVAESRDVFRTALAACGLAPIELDEAVAQVEQTLIQALHDEHGRWVLADHAEAQSEFAVTGLDGGGVRRCKMDRTFVDESGARWIVDFKTGSHQGGDLQKFLDNEQERYRDQLEGYARLMRQLDPKRPIKLALYYPLLGGWREWASENAKLEAATSSAS